MWLNFLTMLRRGCWAGAALLLAWCGNAVAADANFNGSTPLPATCTLNVKTYTCTGIVLVNWNDKATIASGYTVIISSNFAPAYDQGLTMSGSAALQTTNNANVNLSASNNINISGGSFNVSGDFTPVFAGKTITATINAATVTTGGEGLTINGAVTASGAINFGNKVTVNGPVSAASITTGGEYTKINGSVTATGAINFGSSTTVSGAVSGASITTGSASALGSTLSITGAISLGSANTISGAVNGGSISTSSNVTLSSTLTVGGTADLGSNIKLSGDLKANAVKTNSPSQFGGIIEANTSIDLGSGATVNGSVKGATITTGSPVTLKGNVTATNPFTLASGSTVTGNISAPGVTLNSSNSTVKGDIITGGTLDIGSGNTVTGTVKAATLVLRSSGAVINGNVTISGDVDMQSGSTINGDLKARDVTTRSGSAVINGNAALNSIYIDWNNSVTGVITCTGALNGSEPCSCVSKPQYYNYTPRCGAAPSGGLHHFQIEHSGAALTCQPQPVKLKACADANCSSTYTGETEVTLAPNGGKFKLTGSGNGTVSWPKAATVPLQASADGVAAANVCINASNAKIPCEMTFSDTGLVLTAADHISMAPGVTLRVQALQNSQGSCVPLVADKAIDVNFSCGYVNPASGARNVPVKVGGTDVSCGGSTTKVSLSFNSSGLATPGLQYAEVGQASINAVYATGNLSALGATQFTAAPASFKLEPQRADGSSGISQTIFAKASEPFTIKLTALNAAGNVTENFGREFPPQGFAMQTPELIIPDQSDKNRNNAIKMGSNKGTVKGVAAAEDGSPGLWQFDDTGTIKVTVKQAHATTYYLGNTTTGFNTIGTATLTFIPDHFDVIVTEALQMDCNKVNSLVNPCSPANTNGKLLYAGQPFDVRVQAYIGAKDNQGNYRAPHNYTGANARAVTLSALNVDGTAAAPGTVVWSSNATSPFSFSYNTNNDKTLGELSAGNRPSFRFVTAPATPNAPGAPTTIRLRAADSDGASSTGFAEPLITMVSGRLEIANISGPLTGTVPVTARAQYWNGKAYVFNPQYTSGTTPLSLSRTDAGVKTYYLKYSGCKNGFAAPCSASAMPRAATESITFKNGVGTLRLAQPTPALTRNGSLNLSLRNPAFENASDAEKDKDAELIRYLPSGAGTVIFGVYRSGPMIYLREVYN